MPNNPPADAARSPADIVDQLFHAFHLHGNQHYGENVTQLEHALQAAELAERDHQPPALVAAALLHDIGHLLHDLPEDFTAQGVDDLHEDLAARALAQWFGPEVTEPIRMHVAAKRYLCTVEPEYCNRLSPTSLESFMLQGGLMSAEERAQFEASPHALAAVTLRRYDDDAKIPACAPKGLEHFRPALLAALRPAVS